MNDPLTNGWLQLAIAGASALAIVFFILMLRAGQLRFPTPDFG